MEGTDRRRDVARAGKVEQGRTTTLVSRARSVESRDRDQDQESGARVTLIRVSRVERGSAVREGVGSIVFARAAAIQPQSNISQWSSRAVYISYFYI